MTCQVLNPHSRHTFPRKRVHAAVMSSPTRPMDCSPWLAPVAHIRICALARPQALACMHACTTVHTMMSSPSFPSSRPVSCPP
eukprot:3381576-Pleurochrysis_carterae.AAC.1